MPVGDGQGVRTEAHVPLPGAAGGALQRAVPPTVGMTGQHLAHEARFDLLPEAGAPGQPCGATLPHPAPPVQHQPKSRGAVLRLAAGRSASARSARHRRRGGWRLRWGARVKSALNFLSASVFDRMYQHIMLILALNTREQMLIWQHILVAYCQREALALELLRLY